jgi:hypothetical protein
MKFLFIGLIVGIISLLLTSCPMGSSGAGGGTTSPSSTIVKVATQNAKTLYLGSLSLPSSSGSQQLKAVHAKGVTTKQTGSAITVLSALSYASSTGALLPVIFTTADGGQAVLNVTSLRQISNTMIAFAFNEVITVTGTVQGNTASYAATSTTTVSKTSLADMNSGLFYDFTGYDVLSNAVASGGYLYTTNAGTVYKINLSNISSAIPLTNGSYTNVGQLLFVTTNGKLITTNYSIDINGNFIPQNISGVTEGGYYFSINELSFPGTNTPYIIDSQGNVWGYLLTGIISSLGGSGNYCLFQLSIDDSGQTAISNYATGTLSPAFVAEPLEDLYVNTPSLMDTSRVDIGQNCFATIAVLPSGGIQIQSSAFNTPNSPTVMNPNYLSGYDSNGDAINRAQMYNNSLYWMDATTIYTTSLTAGNAVSALYSNPKYYR